MTSPFSADEIAIRVKRAIPDADVEVVDTVGDAQHWRIQVRSRQFAGLRLLEQHRLVMSALKDEIGGRMHAVEIKTIVAE